MSRITSGLVTVVVAGTLGVVTVVGCSAEGSSGAVEETSATETETEESGTTLPPSSSSGSLPNDAGKPDAKDASPKDSAPPDAGPPPPVPGTVCSTADEVRKKSCGACGTQSTICLDVAGTKTWSVYSPCESELLNGCIPGTVIDEPCGNCGTQKKTCTQYCAFTTAACTGQPASSCVPGSVELTGAGCATDLFHQRTCGATCTAPSFSVACSAPPTLVEVGPSVGSISSTIAILSASQTLPRISGTSCPNATFPTTVVSPYVYIQVHNPLAKAATVAIYNSLATGGVAFKTALAAYAGGAGPTTDPARAACIKATTYGTTSLTGDVKFASLDGASKGLTIAAGATVSVYVAAYYAYDPTKPADSTGKVKLNVSTVSLQ